MRGKLRYLQQRNGFYRYIRSIPRKLQPVAGKQQWIKVLGTADRESALAAVPRCDAAFNSEMRRLRGLLERAPRKPTEADVHTIATDVFLRFHSMQEEIRRENPPKTLAERDAQVDVMQCVMGIHSEQLALGDVDYLCTAVTNQATGSSVMCR